MSSSCTCLRACGSSCAAWRIKSVSGVRVCVPPFPLSFAVSQAVTGRAWRASQRRQGLSPKPQTAEYPQLHVRAGAVPHHPGNGHGPPSPSRSPSPFVGGKCRELRSRGFSMTLLPTVLRVFLPWKVRTAENMLLPTQVERHRRLRGRL